MLSIKTRSLLAAAITAAAQPVVGSSSRAADSFVNAFRVHRDALGLGNRRFKALPYRWNGSLHRISDVLRISQLDILHLSAWQRRYVERIRRQHRPAGSKLARMARDGRVGLR